MVSKASSASAKPVVVSDETAYKTPSIFPKHERRISVKRSQSERKGSVPSIKPKASVRLLKKKKLVRNASAEDSQSGSSPISAIKPAEVKKKNSFINALDRITGAHRK